MEFSTLLMRQKSSHQLFKMNGWEKRGEVQVLLHPFFGVDSIHVLTDDDE